MERKKQPDGISLMSRIGILGGTFDPIHLGHLRMAQAARRELSLDEVWFMPTKLPPHKEAKNISDEKTRAAMIQLAIEDTEGFFYSDFELRRNETTYTAKTVALLKKTYPEHTFYFIAGADSLFSFHTWYQPDKILENVVLSVVSREDISTAQMEKRAAVLSKQYGGAICIIPMEPITVSSTMIREKRKAHESVAPYLPKKVLQYIQENDCYS